MPNKSKSEGMFRGRSRSRSRGRPRSRSRARSKTPSRTKSNQSPSPKKASIRQKKITRTPSTPTRQSARIKDIVERQESEASPMTVKGDEAKGDHTPVTRKTAKAKVAVDSKYEFGGPVGVFFMMVMLVTVMYGINLTCNKKSCTLAKLPTIPRTLAAYFDKEVVMVSMGWLLFQALLMAMPIGKTINNVPQKGKVQNYRKNGFLSLVVSIAVLSVLMYLGYPVTLVYDKYIQFMTTFTVASLIFAGILYFMSRNIKDNEKSLNGNTGNAFYDFCIGRQMFPRVGPVDLHLYTVRFTMMTWAAINSIIVWKAYTSNTLNPALAVVAVFQVLYVADWVFFEESFLSCNLFNYDGCGWLATMNMVVMPFLYCLQTRYLMEHPRTWHPGCVAGFVFLNLVGYVIYRGSNSEKDRFRRDPHNPCFASYNKIPTSSGKKLLASGWWGLCRHPNYLGDLIMAFAWSLPCGFDAVLPYYYPALLTSMLVMLAQRDAVLCHKKHGAGYERYCREVKYHIIPYVY